MPTERIRIGDDYYLLASALPPRGRRLLLNDGDTFAIFDEVGDVPIAGLETFGLFCRGTRFLSRFELRINGTFPLLLNATTADDHSEVVSYLTNPDERNGADLILQRDSIAIRRCQTLIDGALLGLLQMRNYSVAPLALRFEVLFDADFADVFELRGVERLQRGETAPARIEANRVCFSYTGRDGVVRKTELHFDSPAWRIGSGCATLDLRLEPGEESEVEIITRCAVGGEAPRVTGFRDAARTVSRARAAYTEEFPKLTTSNSVFDEWVHGSIRDLAVLRAHLPSGPYVYAGIPWFATVFGRDGLITAFETLAFDPTLAAGTLRTLAALQGRRHDPIRDEQPGKILHELREGEMAATGEVPFARYYGSVDATPLFLCLLAAYVERTADLDLVHELWPAALAAMECIERNLDQRGYLVYERRTVQGLVNQGWKDSHDSISHADGQLAQPPIALCEVQAYLYAALLGMAGLAHRLDDTPSALKWMAAAASLRDRFSHDFWMPDEGTYALALDGDGMACRVVTSNAGHCLLTGLAEQDQAERIAERLMREDCFCGWGVRTLSSAVRRYNPMSYHNGSVWPHDNALIAAGFARYGFGDKTAALLTAFFKTSLEMEDRRLPELFCGFPREQWHHPVPYPVACRPQAWAAGSVLLMLQAVLGLQIDAWTKRVTLTNAVLPDWLEFVDIRGLEVATARLDLRVRRGSRSAAVEILAKEGDVDVFVRE